MGGPPLRKASENIVQLRHFFGRSACILRQEKTLRHFKSLARRTVTHIESRVASLWATVVPIIRNVGLMAAKSGQDALRREGLSEAEVEMAAMSYRSAGLGCYAVVVRFCTMPLEKLAMIANSSQVSSSQGSLLSQAWRITFKDGPLTPFRTVGRASIVAWFLQYSVMGFVFQGCDRVLSHGLPRCPSRSRAAA